MWLLLLFVVFPLLLLLVLFRPRRGLFPGPIQFGVLKTSLQMVKNLPRRHHWHDDLRARYGPVVDISVPGKPTLLLFEPADIELTFNRKLAPDRQRLDGFASAFAKGLVGMPMDDTWARHRRLLAPLFSERMMEKYRAKIDELAEKLCAIVAGHRVDVVPLLGAFALDVIGSCGFGTSFDALDEPDAASNVFVQAAASLLSQVDRMTVHPWLGSSNEIKRASVPFDEQVDRARLEASAARAQFNVRQRSARNMLMHLIDAEERGELTPGEVSDESRTIMVAGAETTGLTISWTLYALARHRDVQERLRALTDDAEKRQFARHCVLEAMRLYPVVIATSRELTDPVELRGVQLPAGTILVVPFYSLNHDAAVWGADVEEFRPDRHEQPPSNSHLFTPFGFGNRVCIGAKFATLEAEIAIVKLVSKFDIALPSDGSGEPTEKLFLTMKPAGLTLSFNPL